MYWAQELPRATSMSTTDAHAASCRIMSSLCLVLMRVFGITKRPTRRAGSLRLIEGRHRVGQPGGHDSSVRVIASTVVRVTEAVEADLPSHGERDHLIPVGREVRVGRRAQDIVGEDLVARVLGQRQRLHPDTLDSHRRHVVGVALGGLVDADLLELPLRVVASTGVLHLRDELDHRVQGQDAQPHGLEDAVLVCDAELGFQDLHIAVVLDRGLEDFIERGLHGEDD